MPISLKSMRLSCVSQSSTAICTTTISSATPPRPLHHRLHTYLSDHTKNLAATSAAAYRKSFSIKRRFSDAANTHNHDSTRRHSSAEIGDYIGRRKSSADIRDSLRRSSADIRDAIRRSPTGSSRRGLLTDTTSFREDLDLDLNLLDRRDTQLLALEEENYKEVAVKPQPQSTFFSGVGNGRSGFSQRDLVKSSQPPAPPGDQVVVLRVSLHCKGCEGKVRKHISKMEGVKSFDIDFEMKKVTVKGNFTPLYVLNSITKVKNAQFWPSPATSSSSSSSGSSTVGFGFGY